ncbi:polysaccharide deacetylase family protein [Streptomyces sp. NPDC046805]|uniref:polysaccharide deacetylase family protein n=1 Tax=Streptomyces sp. NPDC046805 TaxID=3155134 RepID=UPI0033C43CC9
MRVVVQNDKYGVLHRRVAVRGALAVLAAAALLSGCTLPGTKPDVRPAPGQEPLKGARAPGLDDYTARRHADRTALVAAARYWGLDQAPLTPPPPPAHKPRITVRPGFEVEGEEGLDLPPVFTAIPTRQKVVFLTLDDGAEKDPAFLRMMTDLHIPYTAFLSNDSVEDDYGFFRRAQAEGVTLDNHTLHHPYLPGLSYDEQEEEICGMQAIMTKQFGRRPTVFRPPYGNYNRNTLLAARSCGIKYAPIWEEEVFADHWEYRGDDTHLHPGDIVLSHFQGLREWNGTLPDMIRRFLNKVTREGYAVARLEDYL